MFQIRTLPENHRLLNAGVRFHRELEAAKRKSMEHAKRAKVLIGRTKMDKESKEFFDAFIDYIVQSLDWYK